MSCVSLSPTNGDIDVISSKRPSCRGISSETGRLGIAQNLWDDPTPLTSVAKLRARSV